MTEYGLATEATDSPYYNPDGYWRGPIWGPTMVLFIEGLEECGEVEFAKEQLCCNSELFLYIGEYLDFINSHINYN